MNTTRRKTTVAIGVTLVAGLGVSLALGIWAVSGAQASSPPAPQSEEKAKADESTSPATNNEQWDPLRQMERMQEEIDRAIHRATEGFEQLNNNAKWFQPEAGYFSSFDLRDRNDRFEVRAYLPDVKASNVSVRLDSDQTLHVSVKQEKQQVNNSNGNEARITELGEYEQVVTLPEPVKRNEMKIDHKGHELIITIPKTNETGTQAAAK